MAKLYFRILKPYEYAAWKDYSFTDERLKFVHLMEAVNYTKIALMPHAYFEFGCHSARTFSSVIRAANFLGMKDMEFYAFDSFQGLPKTEADVDGIFVEGEFHTSLPTFLSNVRQYSGKELDKKYIVEGFYSESLTDSVKKRMPKAGIIHIDVDLYSSTVSVLEFVKESLVVGTVLIFDDWYCFPPGKDMGEKKALNEFLEKYPSITLEEWKSYSTFGKSFFVKTV